MEKRYDTWVEIDLNANRHNLQTIALIAGKPVMAIIKANAYGHGMIPVGKAAIAAVVRSWLSLVSAKHRIATGGITAPILVSDIFIRKISKKRSGKYPRKPFQILANETI